MEMKKWSNPQLKNLKLVGTQTGGECTCGAKHGILVMSNNVHFCHSLGEWHENGCKKTEGHYRNDKCNTHWNTSKDSKCCCGERVS